MFLRSSFYAASFLTAACCAFAQQDSSPVTDRERALLDRIASLEARLSALEARMPAPPSSASAPHGTLTASPAGKPKEDSRLPDWLNGVTVNAQFDGYYAWNTNRPLGRVNLLRAYDALSNNFTINQTGLIVEKAPAVEAGRRWGFRVDLMYGSATETLQGGAQNEPRPQVYRNLFQAYGTYVAPVGKGLTIDFGKWASALGPESNYTKDQINYSRSYFFNFLPFYHMGFRTLYSVTDKISVGYWLINGANQTEDFNNFKSQVVQLNLKPSPKVSWTLQYYAGREQRDVSPNLNPGIPTIATQPGLSTIPVRPVPRGRLHILDTYASWNATKRLALSGEFDYVINRVESASAPQRITGGAAYLKYQFTPKLFFGQRYVRLNDKAGLFSGVSQSLNDTTSTLAYRFAEGFETRFEYRRDFSDIPFFLTATPGRLTKNQQTFTLGWLWWFGDKQGSW